METTEFYEQLVARAAALPNPGADVAAFLEIDRLLKEVVAELPVVQGTNGEPAPDPSVTPDRRTLALLKLIAARDLSPVIYLADSPWYLTNVRPHIWGWITELNSRAPWEAEPLGVVVAFLATASMEMDLNQHEMALERLRKVHSMLGAPAVAVADALAALQRRTSSAVQVVDDIRATCASMTYTLALAIRPKSAGAGAEQMRALMAAHARLLVRLQPDNPRSYLQLYHAENIRGGRPTERMLADLQRGLSLARQQRNSYWRVVLASKLAVQAARASAQSCSPAQAASLKAEADAAYAACRRCLPRSWVAHMDLSLQSLGTWGRVIAQNAAESPAQWSPSILARHSGNVDRAHGDLAARGTVSGNCAGCGRASWHLRRCSRCRQPDAQYCSTECQRSDWRRHRLTCRPEKSDKAVSKGGSSG